MKHILKTNNFYLELELDIFEENLEIPINTIMNIYVESYGFIGRASLEIDIKQLYEFAISVYELYNSLTGTAKITEHYGHKSFLEISGDKSGHINIKGEISYTNNFYTQELKFENEFDQTYLKDFATEIFEIYGKYNNK